MGVGDTPHFICSYRCYNGELFAQGTKQEMSIGRAPSRRRCRAHRERSHFVAIDYNQRRVLWNRLRGAPFPSSLLRSLLQLPTSSAIDSSPLGIHQNGLY